MNMQKIRNKPHVGDKRSRKKHVESMFLTNKLKKYVYYHKKSSLSIRVENVLTRQVLPRASYSIKMQQSGYVTLKPLKALVRIFKWFSKTQGIEEGLKLRLNVFPDFVLTSKPKEMRMGKGKGAPEKKVAIVKKGAVLLTLIGDVALSYLSRNLITKLSQKVPYKHKVVFNDW